MANELAVRETGGVPAELSVPEVLAQMKKVQELMKDGMKSGEHFGVIPGTERKDKEGNDISKPTLLKPGAEKICFMFRLAPSYVHVKERDGKHLTVESICTLTHINTGQVFATGSGMCSTYESKYAYRRGSLVCPTCSKENIRRSKKPDRSGDTGWYCWANTGGCGTNFRSDDASITKQEVGRIANEDVADQWNTVMKMADKRALIAASLNATAASDIFTQDLDEINENLKAARKEAGEDEPASDPTPPAEKPAERVSGATAGTSEPKAEPKKAATRPAKDTPVETTAKTVSEPAKAVPASGKPTDVVSAEERAWFENECKETGAIMTMLLKQKNRESPAQITVADMDFYKQVLAKRREKMTAGN